MPSFPRFSERDMAILKTGVAMSVGQWDDLLASAYDNGAILLDVDDDQIPINAYW
jgi:hypothetical protein